MVQECIVDEQFKEIYYNQITDIRIRENHFEKREMVNMGLENYYHICSDLRISLGFGALYFS